jgi:hypothetical protein
MDDLGNQNGRPRLDPPLERWASLRPPFEAGEAQLLRWFSEHLDPEWEIYGRVYLNGYKPDVVLLHPRYGIALYEVKDWRPECVERRQTPMEVPTPRGVVTEKPYEIWYRPTHGKPYRPKNPVRQVNGYVQEVTQTYTRLRQLLGGDDSKRLVTGGVFLPHYSTEEAQRLLKSYRTEFGKGNTAYAPIFGAGVDPIRRTGSM